MIVSYLLPLSYAIFFGWFLLRNHFLQAAGLPRWFILAFFCGKILTGLLYTWIMLRYIPAAVVDIEAFFGGGLEMYRTFWQSPADFPGYLYETFHITDFSIGRTDSDFIRTVFDGIKFIHFLFNFLSAGELFTNVLLFNCLSAWVFLRCMVYLKKIFGTPWLGAWIFLFPSAFFFTSVILKEGIELVLIASIIPLLYKTGEQAKPVRIVVLMLLFGLMFFFKYLIAATFVAALFLFFLFKKYPNRRLLTSGLSVLAFLILFFNAQKLHPALNLPQYIIDRRLEFLDLEANTELHMRRLDPTPGSFALALPEALHNVLFRPAPGEGGKRAYLIFSAEIIGFWLLAVFLFVRARKWGWRQPGPEAWALLLFALINLVIIGYTITNTGAIIRYRSIFLPGIGYFIWMACQGGKVFEEIRKRSRRKFN